MRVLLAMMSHETNTFSPVPTPLSRFGGGKNPAEGQAILNGLRGRRNTLAGLFQAAEEAGAEVVPVIAAGAPPSGPVDDAAFEYMANLIIEGAAGCDAALLDLHGAMVTTTHEDGEGTLLMRLRERYPNLAVAVGLDMHANLYPAMVENASVISGYHTYPHIDMFETGLRAGRLMMRTLAREISPVMVWGNCPMLPHVMRQGTDDFPNRELQARAIEMEQEGALAVSLFTGFPHADIYNAGLSVVVVTDNNPELAEQYRDELLEGAWQNREKFVYQRESLGQSVDRAIEASKKPGDGPIILLDHYDNTASGGTMDTTEVLREIIKRQLDDVAAFGIFDPAAVDALEQAGVGNTATVSLGGKFHMAALQQQSSPLTVTGEVKLLSDGEFTITGPMGTGARMGMGKTAVLRVGGVDIVVVSRHVEPYDLGCFESLGIYPLRRKYLMLKSRIHYRAAFKPIAKQIIECAGCGVCTSDYSQLTFRNVRRPIFPLDNVNAGSFREAIQTTGSE